LAQANPFQSLFKTSHPEERAKVVRKMFARIARRYDFLNRVMSLGQDLRWRRQAIRNAQFLPGSLILDLGIGTGDMAREVLQSVPGSRVVGFDNCVELMELGQQRAEMQPAPNYFNWILGDGRHLPFAENTFDGVVAGFSVRNIPETPSVVAEVYRILKPGGKFILLDMVAPIGKFNHWIFETHFKFFVPVLGRLFGSDPDAYTYLYTSIVNFYSSAKMRKVFENQGLKIIKSRDVMFRTVMICVGIK
jgi:demethylmenaquinone methyltransferase/2-methoxy-6-polyprenyl-1,4-benzoquinol methylase